MCCFSQTVEVVSDTSIFARGINGHQALVYSMAYAARSDLAMVLPLPVPPRSPEDAVRFINLEDYPGFFDRLESAFPSRGDYVVMHALGAPDTTPLVVHDVGDFEASFVPTLSDFDRLDRRFRIPAAVWDGLPTYRDFGFAVFKLRASTADGVGPRRSPQLQARKVHPMAFQFPRRDPSLLYFPTLHVHDQTVHAAADFDHVLYCQPQPGWDRAVHLRDWDRSGFVADRYIAAVSMTRGLVDPAKRLYRLPLAGRRQNKDTWVSENSIYPELVPGGGIHER